MTFQPSDYLSKRASPILTSRAPPTLKKKSFLQEHLFLVLFVIGMLIILGIAIFLFIRSRRQKNKKK